VPGGPPVLEPSPVDPPVVELLAPTVLPPPVVTAPTEPPLEAWPAPKPVTEVLRQPASSRTGIHKNPRARTRGTMRALAISIKRRSSRRRSQTNLVERTMALG
jgi:hypothetical protein